LDFYGPGLSCYNVNSSAKEAWQTKVLSSPSQVRPIYDGWASPDFGGNYTDNIITYLDFASNDSSKVLVAVYDNSNNTFIATECALINVSYSVDFAFSSGAQNLTLSKKVANGVPAHSNVAVNPVAIAYQSVLYAMNQILVGNMLQTPIGNIQFTDGVLIQLTTLGEINPLCTSLNTYIGGCQNSSFPAALEELFQNMTLSLLSNEYFLYIMQ
jgi:hypothetical protein